MNYVLLSDCLWYTGHVLTGGSVFFSHTNFNVAVFLICFGQFITIVSRPISRLSSLKEDGPEHEIIIA